MTYQDQIKSPKWQKKRLEVMELHHFMCQNCESSDVQLNVHHTVYHKGRKIWDYDNTELRCYCETCHKKIHELDDELRLRLSLFGPINKVNILGYLDGIRCVALASNNPAYILGYANGFKGTPKEFIEFMSDDIAVTHE